MITFAPTAHRRITDHVQFDSCREAGGALLGTGDRVELAWGMVNNALEPDIEFRVHPSQVAEALMAALDHGMDVLGTYHSHPNGSTNMSAADVRLAEATGLLLIVPIDNDGRAAVPSLYCAEHRGEIPYCYETPGST